jgi:hypothetical protein
VIISQPRCFDFGSCVKRDNRMEDFITAEGCGGVFSKLPG